MTEQTNKMYRLLEQLNTTALEEISAILYEQASPFGEINTHVGKWVFVNPVNKQWYSKDNLATARAEGAAEERNKLVKIIEEQIGRIPTNGGIMDIFMGDDGFIGKWIDRDILLEALTTKEHHAS